MLEVWISGVLRVGLYRVKILLIKYRFFVVMFYDLGFDCVVLLIFLDKIFILLECIVNKLLLNFLVCYGDYVLKKYCGILF